MNFYIRQNSVYPNLTLEVYDNNLGEKSNLFAILKNSAVYFYMEEVNSCIPAINCAECCLVEEECNNCENVLVVYKWKNGETKKKGKYRGWIEVVTDEDEPKTMIFPIKEDLFVHIV